MDWKDRMYEALAAMLRDKYGVDAVTVTDFEDRTESGGFCDSCWYEYVVCDITYVDSKGKTKEYTLDDSFSDVISSL